MAESPPLYFLVHCLDAPGAQDRREAAASAHRAYIEQNLATIYMGGPLVDDARQERIGSLLVLNVASRDAARAFMAEEPYNVNGVFESVIIRPFECVVRPSDEQKQEQQ